MIQKPEPEVALKSTMKMVCHKLLPIVGLASSKFSDEDCQEDAAFLEKELTECQEHMSSFDEYRSEILSGRLEWSPVHKSDKFWRDNASRLNEDGYKLVKILVELLEHSLDPQVCPPRPFFPGLSLYPHSFLFAILFFFKKKNPTVFLFSIHLSWWSCTNFM